MLVTYYDCYNVLSKVYSDKTYIKQALSSTQVEPLNKARVTKICYGVLDKDITLEYFLSKLCSKSPKLAIKTLLKIGLYSINYLKTPPHVVTDNLVSLAKKMGKGGVSGFINAVLRNFTRTQIELPSGNDVLSLSIRYSCPDFIVKRLIDSYGLEVALDFLSYDEDKTYIRFNTGIDGAKYLTENNVEFAKTPFDNSFEVKRFTINDDFYSGLYTFQSIGSVAICSVFSGGNSLLDTCSAPGGKAVLLSDKYKSVTACDIHEHRVELINSYASRMNKQNITAMVKDSTIFNLEFETSFDGVLCDVPCSGTGVMKDNPDIKLNRTDNAISEIVKTQLKILENSARYLKKGGELVYSTCSVMREENDGVIEKFIANNNDFEVVDCNSNLPHLKTKFGLQFLPHLSLGAGFYLSKIKRK